MFLFHMKRQLQPYKHATLHQKKKTIYICIYMPAYYSKSSILYNNIYKLPENISKSTPSIFKRTKSHFKKPYIHHT